MNKKVYNYIVKDLLSSNAFYWTTGCPEKRMKRIKEYAWYLLTNMDIQKYKIYEQRADMEQKKI